MSVSARLDIRVNRTCVVVADATRARFYGVEAVDSPCLKSRLVERTELANPDFSPPGKGAGGRPPAETPANREAGPARPIEAQRERHRLELDRRFGQEIAREAAAVTREWEEGTVVLVTEPRILGLLHEPLRAALHQGIELKELAKDYTHLTASELHEHLALNKLVPVVRRTAL